MKNIFLFLFSIHCLISINAQTSKTFVGNGSIQYLHAGIYTDITIGRGAFVEVDYSASIQMVAPGRITV
jgi:hypothetical protein